MFKIDGTHAAVEANISTLRALVINSSVSEKKLVNIATSKRRTLILLASYKAMIDSTQSIEESTAAKIPQHLLGITSLYTAISS